ncbi:MAG TPA: hypothetical protein VME70_16520 [Mycobacteriales bacterium]|nr:hypothetical protein [Mycobacteriales bacterium]
MTAALAEDTARTTPVGNTYQPLALLVVLQAGWVAWLCTRGWFYQDDFTLLSQGLHHSLTPGYLTMPFNGHLTPGVRLVFWILARTSKLDYAPTIVVRVVLQAVSTVLLALLLERLGHSRRLAFAITALYCASPLLVPGTLWLSSSMNLLTAQVCVLVTYLAHVRHAETGRLRWSAVAGVALVVGVGFWEKTAVTAVLLVVLSAGWLTSGSLRARIVSLVRDWRGWVYTFGPLALFAADYFTHHYSASSAHRLPAHVAVHLIWLQWGHSLWAAAIGAPWRWLSAGTTYTGVADPRTVTVVLGQVAFVALLAAGWWRNRWRGVLAWLLPALAVVIGMVVVGIGRYTAFGDLVGLQFSYAFDLAVPTAIAAALALAARPGLDTGVQARAAGVAVEPARHRRRSVVAVVVGAAVVVALIASGAGSAWTWSERWHESPARGYVTAIRAGIRQHAPTANLFDTYVSPVVIPEISRDRRLSDLLALTDSRVVFDRGPGEPDLVTAQGRLVAARFEQVASQIRRPNAFCPTLLRGTRSITVRLGPKPDVGAYFLRIEYFEQRPAIVRVRLRDAKGTTVGPTGPATVDFDQRLGAVILPVRLSAPTSVTFSSGSANTSVCMSTVVLGVPTPAGS